MALVPLLLGLASCTEPGSEKPPRPVQLDALIINGLVYDGSDSPGQIMAIGIKDGRISFVGDHRSADLEADQTIDAAGKIVVPGFIDPHTHSLSELQSSEFNANLNYLTQGVTTVFVGNDGGGTHRIAALSGELESRGIGTNVAFLVGHGAVREAIIGREAREPVPAELTKMRELVLQAMKEGAVGLSSGLYYAPGSFATTNEVIALARAAAQYDGVYDSHIRDESTYNIGLSAAIEEAIEVGRQAGLPVHIAHIKALGVDVWGQSGKVISLIEEARSEGLQITADQYPWRASGTHLGNAVVPRWVMAGSAEKYQARLRDSKLLPEIEEAVNENIRRRGGAESLLIVDCPAHEYEGKTLAEVAQSEGLDPVDAALDILRLGSTRVVSFNMNMEDIGNFMAQDWVVTSSDGNDGHPRKYASFPRKYSKFVIEKRLLSTHSFVHRSSGLTADIFGLEYRGYLKPGYFADIAIINPENYGPQADYFHWNTLSSGVEYLYVNGVLAIERGVSTLALTGQALRKKVGG